MASSGGEAMISARSVFAPTIHSPVGVIFLASKECRLKGGMDAGHRGIPESAPNSSVTPLEFQTRQRAARIIGGTGRAVG